MSRQPTRPRRVSIAANPVLVGAVTTLVLLTAVFLAYNANSGLPFVPVYEIDVETPDAARLVVGNEVREGGERIGQVSQIETVRTKDGQTGAKLRLQLDRDAGPLPLDSRIIIRPRSTLGLKYVDVVRGRSAQSVPEGAVLPAGQSDAPPELDDLFGIFDDETREHARTNLTTFGDGFAGRGEDLNQALADLPELLGDLAPVMATLAEPSTGLTTFVRELADVNRVLRPVADALVSGLGSSADVFEAISRDPEALQDAIAESPATLRAGLRSFPVQRPFLRDLADISDELAGTAREIRAGAPTLSRALATGTEVLPTTPPFNRALRGSLEALRGLSASPTTNLTLGGLESTFDTLTPTLRYLGPHITVCNYWNSWWTLLADHISEQDATGTVQRIQVKQAPGQLGFFGATRPANGGEADPVTHAAQGDVPALHTQPYGRAVDEQGDADCESGQRGYPLRLAEGAPEGLNIAVDPRTPGSQGPTATGRPRVPDGQTFTAEPGGISPQVVK